MSPNMDRWFRGDLYPEETSHSGKRQSLIVESVFSGITTTFVLIPFLAVSLNGAQDFLVRKWNQSSDNSNAASRRRQKYLRKGGWIFGSLFTTGYMVM